MVWLVCISNAGYEIDLTPGQLYQQVVDGAAEQKSLVRIIDDSGQSYLFPSVLFMPDKSLPPITASLKGSLPTGQAADLDKDSYYAHLENKHQ